MNTPNETPSFSDLQGFAKNALITEELCKNGIKCVAGAYNPETGEMYFTTPNLEEFFETNPDLHQALETKLRTTFLNHNENL